MACDYRPIVVAFFSILDLERCGYSHWVKAQEPTNIAFVGNEFGREFRRPPVTYLENKHVIINLQHLIEKDCVALSQRPMRHFSARMTCCCARLKVRRLQLSVTCPRAQAAYSEQSATCLAGRCNDLRWLENWSFTQFHCVS